MTNLTDKDLAEIRARAEAATEGPWQRSYFVDGPQYLRMSLDWKRARTIEEGEIIRGPGTMGTPICNIIAHILTGERDREFIAHARTDIPALLAHIDRQAAEIERLRAIEQVREDARDRAALMISGAKLNKVVP